VQTDRFEHFDEGARKVMELAEEEARRFNHNYIGTEHLLLGLVREGEGPGAQALESLGVSVTKVRSAVEFIIGRGDRQVMGDVGLTPRAKKVMQLSNIESKKLGNDHVGTEHILLGLIREGEGIAAGILESLGVSLERARGAVIELLTEPAPEETLDGAWQYLAVPVVETESQSYVVASYGDEEDVLSDLSGRPLEEATRLLTEDGWHLVGKDPTFQPPQGPGGLYVFKRRKRLGT
jgi:ATP-dependent Clp protease ATP-binding subunit ClpA